MTFSDPVRSAPNWVGDYFDARDHILPFAMKLDVASFPRRDGVIVTVGAAGAQGGVDEVQTVSITGTPTGGTFTLTWSGQITAAIAYNADAAAVQAALEALSNINVGDVKVYGNNPNFTVVFGGSLGKQNVAAMTASGASLTGGTSPGVTIATTVGGVAGATSIPVTALTGAIPNGTVLDFGGTGRYAKLTAAAASGATSLTVEALPESVGAGDTATYPGVDTDAKNIPSGTLVGRTYAERAANDPFGPAAASDDEIYLLAFEIPNTDWCDDGEAYRPGSVVKENYLPQWSTMGATLQGIVRAKYQCITGIN